jgi:prepilin-type N-terminal cleavage/methylation domain-containing protein
MNKYKSNSMIQQGNQDKGFSLIEVAIAMTTLGLCLAYAMPLILFSKINNSKSEMRTGALMVTQKIFDDVRSRTFGRIPSADTTVNNTTSTDATIFPALGDTKALGKTYKTTIRFCQSECTDNYRKFKITVRDPIGDQSSDNSIVYEMEAAFTDFK